MLRPGRLDKILYVGLPSCKDRADILIAVTKVKSFSTIYPNVDFLRFNSGYEFHPVIKDGSSNNHESTFGKYIC